MDENQKEYIPTMLRTETQSTPLLVRWGLGEFDPDGNAGMHHGPFKTELEALEIIGQNNWMIFRLDGMSSVPVWSWDVDRWVKTC